MLQVMWLSYDYKKYFNMTLWKLDGFYSINIKNEWHDYSFHYIVSFLYCFSFLVTHTHTHTLSLSLSHVLLGGSKGHTASCDWWSKKLWYTTSTRSNTRYPVSIWYTSDIIHVLIIKIKCLGSQSILWLVVLGYTEYQSWRQ